jgi:hypothetical protein
MSVTKCCPTATRARQNERLEARSIRQKVTKADLLHSGCLFLAHPCHGANRRC